jgi:hypothetical protein
MLESSTPLLRGFDERPRYLVELGASETSSLANLSSDAHKHMIGSGEQSLSPRSISTTRKPSLEERLFDTLSDVKVLTSKVAMHLQRDWRDQLFRQLDDMHDANEWEEDDATLKPSSFATFLRSWFLLKPERSPGLGISGRGNLVGGWWFEDTRLTLEFVPDDFVTWLVTIPRGEWVERASGTNKIGDLDRVLSPYNPAIWFSIGKTD